MKFTLLVLLTFSLVAPVCAIDKPAGESEVLWKPEVGDFWVYEVVADLPKDTHISISEQFGNKRQATYKETSVIVALIPVSIVALCQPRKDGSRRPRLSRIPRRSTSRKFEYVIDS